MTNEVLSTLHVLMTGVKDPMPATNTLLPQNNSENAVLSFVLDAVRTHLISTQDRVGAVEKAQADVSAYISSGYVPEWVSLAVASDLLADMQLKELAQRDKALSYVKKVFTWVLGLLGI